jgi:preprotein translocase subunit YajC
MATFFSSLPLLQTAASGSGSMLTMIVPFALIIVIFYFLIIRPQRKKQKETKDMLATLRPGDKVATAGGIRGTVKHVKETTVTIKVDTNTTVEFNKSAVTNILERKESKESAEETKE